MITNKAIQKKPEHKQVIELQSWYEPALRTLDGLLEIRRANLRKIKGDEKNAAVTRDEFMEMLAKAFELYEAERSAEATLKPFRRQATGLTGYSTI